MLLAALVGMAFVAYNAPGLFIFVQNWLLGLIMVVVGGALVWNVSNTVAMSAVARYVPSPSLDAAMAAADRCRVNEWWGMGCMIGAIAYLTALGLVAAYRKASETDSTI